MKSFLCSRFIRILSLTALAFSGATAVSAPAVRRGANFIPPLSTNELPKSVYVVPATPNDGRDPFFPKSDRLARATGSKKSGPKTPQITLFCNGISGTLEHRLAIINGRTLAEGEETEILVNNTRVKIRCVEIKGETVIVEAMGERRELRLGTPK